MQIQKTDNHDQFKKIRGNRSINRNYLKLLIKSIEENNMLEANPIIVTEDMQVIDGQHRLRASEELNTPIYYVVAKGNIDTVRNLNVNQRYWRMQDFLESYLAQGKKEYKKLKKFMDKYGVSIAIARGLLTGGRMHGASNAESIRAFKEGDFKVTHPKFAKEMAEKAIELEKITGQDLLADRNFVMALDTVYASGITHKKLKEQLERVGHIEKGRLIREWLQSFERVMSYGKRSQVSIPYVYRTRKKDKNKE